MTETEKKVVDILVDSGVAADERKGVHAVGSAMPQWSTEDTRKFINDLRIRGLVNWYPIASDRMEYDPKGKWQKPED
jgi:hypothetical protein